MGLIGLARRSLSTAGGGLLVGLIGLERRSLSRGGGLLVLEGEREWVAVAAGTILGFGISIVHLLLAIFVSSTRSKSMV